MTIDDRGRASAAGLRRSVEGQVDTDRAWVALQDGRGAAGAGGRDGRGSRLLLAAAMVLVICLVGTVAVIAEHSGRVRNDAIDDPRLKIGQALPASRIDGKQSWGLPVVASPQAGIRDGQQISVIGRGFEPGENVGFVFCSSEAATEAAGIDACQLSSPGNTFDLVEGYANANDEGIVIGQVEAQRFIDTPRFGRVDCQSVAERCMVGVGAVSNYDRSGASYLLFAGSPAFPEVSASVAPSEQLAPGQQVIVSIAGSIPGRSESISQCVGDRCTLRAVAKVGPDGRAAAGIRVYGSVRDDKGEVPCDGRCTIAIRGWGGVKEQSSAPQPPPKAITFDPKAPEVATPPPSTVPPTTVPPTTVPPTIVPPTTGSSGPDTTMASGSEPASTAPSTVPSSTPPTTRAPTVRTLPAAPGPTTTVP